MTRGALLSVDAVLREKAARDFGGLVEGVPRAVVRARSIADVAAAVQMARSLDFKLAARGAGHSTRGQSLAPDGIVVDTDGLGEVQITGQSVRVGAGARWHTVLRCTLEHGLVPPTLTDYLGLSVGGTLSVGGVGGQSFLHGLQVDQVSELVVVTGGGETIECSAEQHADLFFACLAGLGQCAIIVAATLRLVPAPQAVRVYRLPCRDLAGFLSAQLTLAQSGLAHYLLGSMLPRADGFDFELEVGEYLFATPGQSLPALLAELHPEHRLPPADLLGVWQHASRLDAMEVAMQRSGTWGAQHPWLDLFLPSSVAHAVISNALAELVPDDLIDGHLMTYPLARAHRRAPLVALPDEPHAFLFDILPSVRFSEVARGARLEQALRRILRHARGLGASVYPIGFPIGTSEMSCQHWREQLGGRWAAFEASKRRHDPDRLLTPGPRLFDVDG